MYMARVTPDRIHLGKFHCTSSPVRAIRCRRPVLVHCPCYPILSHAEQRTTNGKQRDIQTELKIYSRLQGGRRGKRGELECGGYGRNGSDANKRNFTSWTSSRPVCDALLLASIISSPRRTREFGCTLSDGELTSRSLRVVLKT